MDNAAFIPHIPPQNLDMEQAILGAVLMDGTALTHVRKLLPADFYRSSHGIIFAAMLRVDRRGDPVDLLSVNAELRKDGKLDEIGGSQFLTGLVSQTFTSTNITFHARAVKELSSKRQLITACREVERDIMEQSLDEALAVLRQKTQGLAAGRGGRIVSYRELVKSTYEFIEERFENKDSLSGIPSGFVAIDDLTDGWQSSDLIILGARPSQGKSALSQAFCENAGVPAGIIQIEMGEIQTGIRAVSRESAVELWKLRKGILNKSDWQRLTEAAARLVEKEVFIDFSTRKLSDVERTFTAMVENHGVQFVVLDYLQLADADHKDRSREQEVAATSKLLKHLAKGYKIPVMALAQLNREIEKRVSKKPTLSDLKESGQIEQDADMVIFLYQDDKRPNVAILDFAKGRNIGLGTVKLFFDKDHMTFRNYKED
jgi:replicative DNA helicase